MNDWQVFGIILGSSASAAVVSGIVALITQWMLGRNQKDALAQQRLTETTRLIMEIAATAHARTRGSRVESVGFSEQVAALEALIALGIQYKLLRPTVHAYLETHLEGYAGVENSPYSGPIANRAKAGIDRLEALSD